jgi:ABC-type transport system substrate-binding protein
MLQSYLNLRLLHRDEQMQVVPLWATEWRQANEGIYFILNPKAKWQDGTPATAEDFKANVEALLGKYAPDFKGTPRIGQFKRVVQEVQIIDPLGDPVVRRQRRLWLCRSRPGPPHPRV